MDNERNDPRFTMDDAWLDEILGTQKPAQEIGPDEHAVSSAGLTHPDDLEIEKIMSEVRKESKAQPYGERHTRSAGEKAAYASAPQKKPNAQQPVRRKQQTPSQKGKETAARKGRPEKKKGYGLFGIPHIVSTILWIVVILAVGVALGRTLWVCCADLMAFGKADQEVTITITENDDIDSISRKLSDAGLVDQPKLFKMFAQLTGKDDKISVGTFTLNAKLDYNAMIRAMGTYSTGREEVTVMFPEGYSCAQIFQRLEDYNVCTAEELEEYAANGELDDYWFLEGVERGDKYCLEGYMFPDTYNFYTNDSPKRVIEKFLDNFDKHFTDLMKDKLEPLNKQLAATLSSRGYGAEYIEAHKITIREVVIVASMIEKETANDDESYTISSVIYNRLTNPANYPYLNIDAALVYGLGEDYDASVGLTDESKRVDTPYNTYLYAGLIPGPISNPGQNSLDAALAPLSTGYYYYVYNPETASHIFAKTLDEHEKNIAKVNS